MLKYSLQENKLTEEAEDYSALVHIVQSLGMEAVITRMLNKGTLLTRTDIVAVLNNFNETIVDILLEGNTVNLPLFNISFSISGVFESPLDSFDGNRHKFNINLTKGILLRDTEKQVKFEKTNTISPMPQIQEVKDSVSGLVNEILTPKGVIEVYGYNLKIEGDDPACGLWFITDDGSENKAEVLIENKPSKILAMIPELLPGGCRIKIVTQFTGSGTLVKMPRVYTYPKVLQI